MLQLKIPGIVTTYITGTWTTLMSGLVRIKSQTPNKERKSEQRLLMQAAILAVYFLSAALTGCLLALCPRCRRSPSGTLGALCGDRTEGCVLSTRPLNPLPLKP